MEWWLEQLATKSLSVGDERLHATKMKSRKTVWKRRLITTALVLSDGLLALLLWGLANSTRKHLDWMEAPFSIGSCFYE